MDDDRRTHLRTKLLRGLTIWITALGLVAIVLSFIPSIEIYEDARNCLGEALGRVFSWHGGRGAPCAENWVLTETRPPVDDPFAMALYLAALLLPGLLVWRQPKLVSALAWMLWTMIATGVWFVMTFRLFDDVLQRTVHLPLAQVFGAAFLALLGTLIALVPAGCLVFAIVTRKRRPPPPVFPTARVVER